MPTRSPDVTGCRARSVPGFAHGAGRGRGVRLRRLGAVSLIGAFLAGMFALATPAPAVAEPGTPVVVASGPVTSYVVTAEGDLYGAGDNSQSQIPGVADTSPSSFTRATLPAGVRPVQVAGGRFHVLIRTGDGRVFAAGLNSNGQLGLGDYAPRTSFAEVPLPAGLHATSIAAGLAHSVILLNNGSVYAAGSGSCGQLGRVTMNASNADLAPMMLPAFPAGAGIVEIAAGALHTVLRGSDGTVYSTGWNGNRQQGLTDTTTPRSVPAALPMPTGVVAGQIAAGGANTSFVGSNGRVYVIGADASGQAGDGLATDRATFATFGLPGGVVAAQVVSGSAATLIRTTQGTIYVAGDNQRGGLGAGSFSTPIPVSGTVLPLPVKARQLVAGDLHTIAVGANNRLYVTGFNAAGQLGDGANTDRNTFTRIVGPKARCTATESCGTVFGAAGDRPVPADVDGDGNTDFGVFRNGTWYYDTDRDGVADSSVVFGAAGDRPYAADFDGDGVADLIVFRDSIGTWFIDTNRDGTADRVIHYASPGDVPYVGDFDGNGSVDLGIFRPSEGNWYVDTNGDGAGDIIEHYASPGDVPAPADYDRNGTVDYAIFRPSNGCYYINDGHAHSGTTAFPGGVLPNGFATTVIGFASAGDQMAAGDYFGSGATQLGIFRAATGTWYLRNPAWNVARGDEATACR